MARGLIQILSPSSTIATVSLSPWKCISKPFLSIHLLPSFPRFFPSSHSLFYCNSSSRQASIDNISDYKHAFARRMAMVGLEPHHRIALGVSGGPDSMALSILAAGWKTDGFNTSNGRDGFIDGLLAIIVDHGLRPESRDEANLVSIRVSDLGIACEIARCDWLDGRPKLGHLQEAARHMRYQIFQKVCFQYNMDVLLIAHHADDQAELFMIRLSRNSGVLGLAGMAFTSQLFSSCTLDFHETSKNHGILLVRPLLEFSKEDMYEICRRSNREWVEDPTNQSQLFTRNRIRTSLENFSTCFKSELKALIATCRETRSYVDHICCDLINRAASITDHGYAVIDLEILKPSQVDDISLSKFVAFVLQFISQRHKPVRGSTSKLLLDYIRTFPCKTSFTAAGCYLCAAPGSRGTKILVCCSVNSPLPSNTEISYTHSTERQKQCMTSELEQIIGNAKCYSDKFIPDATNVQFLDVKPELILSKAQKLNIISKCTNTKILQLQEEENERFKSKNGIASDTELKGDAVSVKPGKVYYFMKRFLLSWDLIRETTDDRFGEKENSDERLEGKSGFHHCGPCVISNDTEVEVRHMVDSDWLYLAELLKCHVQQSVLIPHNIETKVLISDYTKLSAQRALMELKSIPVAARRSLPVLLDRQGVILSIPSIRFKRCPCLKVSAIFKPTVPLGGGYTSFL